jgi:hypothetical protein
VTNLDPKGEERRRSPRFNCGGCATINRVPFDGTSISATLRNVSVGGVCLDMAKPVDPGVRTELVLRVNATSFRAAALVKEQRDLSSTSLEFVQISAGGKDVLEDLLERLAKLQALNRKLRSSRIDEDTRRMLTEKKKFEVLKIGSGSRLIGSMIDQEMETPVLAGNTPIESEHEMVETQPEMIEIDLFC